MDNMMALHMVSSMLCCYYPLMHQIPGQGFRPWGTVGYPGMPVRPTRRIDYSNWPGLAKPGERPHGRDSFVPCSPPDLADFLSRLWLWDYSVEFEASDGWHILEVAKDKGCYALDGERFASYGGMEQRFLAHFLREAQIRVIRLNVPVSPIIRYVTSSIRTYARLFIRAELAACPPPCLQPCAAQMATKKGGFLPLFSTYIPGT